MKTSELSTAPKIAWPQIVAIAVSVIVPSVWAAVNISEARATTQSENVNTKLFEYGKEISALNAKIERIPVIESKVDRLLEAVTTHSLN
jgi:hypothetical protein